MKKKTIIIIIVAILVLVLATFAILFFFTDLFNFAKSDSNNFAIQAKKLFGSKNQSSYSEYLASIENLKGKNESFTSNMDISMNLDLPSSTLDSSIQEILNNSSISVSESYDVSKKATAYNIGLAHNNDKTINLECTLKDNAIGLSSPDLYDKALLFDLNKFEEFCKANNIDYDEKDIKSITSTLDKQNDGSYSSLFYDLLYLTEDEYNSLRKNYGDILTSFVDDKNYSSEKNKEINVDGKDVKTTAYTLTLSGQDAYDCLYKLVSKAKDDETLNDIIAKKYDILKQLLQPYTTYYTEFDDEDEPMTDLSNINFDELLRQLEDVKDEFYDLDNSLKFTIYSDKKQNPVRYEISILDDKKSNEYVIFTGEIESKKNTYTIDLQEISKLTDGTSSKDNDDDLYSGLSGSSKTSASVADSISKIIITDEYEESDTSRKGKITISAKVSDEKQDIANITYENTHSSSELKNKFSLSSSVLPVTLDFNYSVDGLNTDKQNVSLDLSGKMSASVLSSYSFGLKCNGSINYGNADIKDLNDSNSVDVLSKSEEEIAQLYTDVVTNASNNLPDKLSKFGMDVTKDDILSSFLGSSTLPAQDDASAQPEASDQVPSIDQPENTVVPAA